MTTMTPTTITADLAKWFTEADIPDTAQAALFGWLVQLSYPHIEHYHSDLYRDSLWIYANVVQPMTFYYAAGKFGTSIGTERKYVELLHADGGLWEVKVTHEEGIWQTHITQIGEGR